MKIKSKVRGGLKAVDTSVIQVTVPRCNPSTRTLGPVIRPVVLAP